MAKVNPEDLKPQVYKDPRPAEYFTRFHERRARGSAASTTSSGSSSPCRPSCFFRARAIGVENVPPTGRGDRHAQPLQPDGPLLRRGLPAAQGPVHGQVPALRQPDPQLDLLPRRRLPGPPRLRRPGGVQDRPHRPRPRRRSSSCTPRAGVRAPATSASPSAASARSRSSRARRWSRSRSTARPTSAAGSASTSPR